MKELYYKIIELPEVQVLVRKNYDTEEEKYSLIISMQIDSLEVSNSYHFEQTEDRDKAFIEADEEHCRKIYEALKKMLTP